MSKLKKPKKKVIILRMIMGIFLWIYLPIKVFIFDIDRFILNTISPDLIPILDYRVLIFISILLLILILFGIGELIKSFSFSIVFPLYLFSRRIKNKVGGDSSKVWIYLQKYGTLISLFLINFGSNIKHHFKFRTFLLVLSLISILMIFLTKSNILINSSILILTIYLIAHYFYKIYQSLSPSNYFTRFSESFSEQINSLGFSKSEAAVSSPYYNKKYEELESISIMVYYIKKWVSKLKDSPYLIVYFVVSTFYTIILTIFIFGIIYFAFYKIDSSFYSAIIIEEINFFSFLYLSLKTFASLENNLFTLNGIYLDLYITIEGLSKYAITIIYAVFLINILRHQLNRAVTVLTDSIDNEMNKLDNVLRKQHQIGIREAIEKSLEKIKLSSRKKNE